MEGYNDASWNLDPEQSKLTNGYVFTLGGGAVSWKMEAVVHPKSTMEAKFGALVATGVEAEWLESLLLDLLIARQHALVVLVSCDYQAVQVAVNEDIQWHVKTHFVET